MAFITCPCCVERFYVRPGQAGTCPVCHGIYVDYHQDTFTPKEAAKCGVNVATAIAEHVETLQNQGPHGWLRRLCSALVSAAASLWRRLTSSVGGVGERDGYRVPARW